MIFHRLSANHVAFKAEVNAPDFDGDDEPDCNRRRRKIGEKDVAPQREKVGSGRGGASGINWQHLAKALVAFAVFIAFLSDCNSKSTYILLVFKVFQDVGPLAPID